MTALDATKLQVKLFADMGTLGGSPPRKLALEPFIPVFHDWIKNHRLPELLIDVANYAHVPKGPGVVLIGHQGDYYIDEQDGRPGLLYSRKRQAPIAEERLADVFRRALHAALLLEGEKTVDLRFRTDELLFRINDRLLAPPGEETFAAWRPSLDALAARLHAGAPSKLALVGGPKELFSVRLTTDGKADLRTLLDRLGGPPPGST
jgi:hypothetical protein